MFLGILSLFKFMASFAFHFVFLSNCVYWILFFATYLLVCLIRDLVHLTFLQPTWELSERRARERTQNFLLGICVCMCTHVCVCLIQPKRGSSTHPHHPREAHSADLMSTLIILDSMSLLNYFSIITFYSPPLLTKILRQYPIKKKTCSEIINYNYRRLVPGTSRTEICQS